MRGKEDVDNLSTECEYCTTEFVADSSPLLEHSLSNLNIALRVLLNAAANDINVHANTYANALYI